MLPELLLPFIGFCFVSSVTPGPNNIMLMASGTNFGVRRTLPHWCGIWAGFTLMIIVVGLGLSRLFEQFPFIYDLLKIVCFAFLIYLAVMIARSGEVKKGDKAARPLKFIESAMFQWVNPKAWLMALTAITTYTATENVSAIFVTAILFGLINGPTCSIWMFVGQNIRRFLQNSVRLRLFNISMALLLVASMLPMFFNPSI